MPSDFGKIQKALDTGADPTLLCQMCSWDVNCVDPSGTSRGDLIEQIDALLRDADEHVKHGELPPGVEASEWPEVREEMRAKMTTLVQDRFTPQTNICPVLALKLATAEGRAIADGFKRIMRGETDASETR